MSKHVKHVPKHRAQPSRTALVKAPKKALRSSLILSSVAVAATGATVSGGVLTGDGELGDQVSTAAAADRFRVALPARSTTDEAPAAERETAISRGADHRRSTDPAKAAALSVEPGAGVTGKEELSSAADPRDVARALLSEYGFGADQFGCLDSLWIKESNWNPLAHNPSSGAHGIPQSLPASKMASEGADYWDNPVTQIKWGLGYIRDRYGSPCSAWGHSQSTGWY